MMLPRLGWRQATPARRPDRDKASRYRPERSTKAPGLQPAAVIVQGTVWPAGVECLNIMDMRTITKTGIVAPVVLLGWLASGVALPKTKTAPKHGPVYTADSQLRLPADYREWVYLSSGFDMSYSPDMQMDHHMFDNVFVNPEAWQTFRTTGKWPDKTVLVLELRGAEGKGSINQKGNFQAEVMGIEVHVKDESRFQGKWAFFGFPDGAVTSKMRPLTEDCYSCHAEHGAVDTTFVQFYPTLKPIAKQKGTLEAAYQKEEARR